ncbi:ketopantoate reductase family protein [Gluconacetobacter entanii]|uniref:2-dehydropantoate 2-reductase n=1 Tax=Gluconacetobacter entanii TaxID=108528 RepID=A0ABT3K3N2_9PROT|nr:ketopantoate reductase family protein [Gluconacetobacter entanii]MCW4590005.1 ketopantoate reductase family protein [Gluconacetobacter entanii]MCW4593875.1 ketopantoate reductase family protein [Gluconacetobacter entanii]NPC89696.1 ketopantoate reductase family protein [Gluconacetobacter entanii]
MNSRILVVGAGAVGGYFGARMASAGHDVTFLVRPRRHAQLLAEGLSLRSTIGDTTISPTMVTAQDITAPYDIVLLSVKAYSLDAAMDDFSPAVGPATRIIPLLNGMLHLDLLAERFGQNAVMGGTCFIVSKLDKEGRIIQSGPLPRLSFGEMSGQETAQARQIEKAFSSPGFETICSQHIVQDMWNKWILLASLGSICCLMRGTVGEIAEQPHGTDFTCAVIRECAAIATAEGHCPDAKTIDDTTRLLCKNGSPLTSSMFRDLSQGAPVEAHQIIGDLVARARKHGLETPLLDLTNLNLQVYELQRRQRATA